MSSPHSLQEPFSFISIQAVLGSTTFPGGYWSEMNTSSTQSRAWPWGTPWDQILRLLWQLSPSPLTAATARGKSASNDHWEMYFFLCCSLTKPLHFHEFNSWKSSWAINIQTGKWPRVGSGFAPVPQCQGNVKGLFLPLRNGAAHTNLYLIFHFIGHFCYNLLWLCQLFWIYIEIPSLEFKYSSLWVPPEPWAFNTTWHWHTKHLRLFLSGIIHFLP